MGFSRSRLRTTTRGDVVWRWRPSRLPRPSGWLAFGRKARKVPKYLAVRGPLSGQGQVVSATLRADIGNECLGSAGRMRAVRSHWFSGRRRSLGMSIDSGAEALPRKYRRVAKRNVEGDISPGLRKHVTQAAKQIRGAHKAELADALKADRAGRLFSSIIRPNGTKVGPLKRSPGGSSEGMAALAGEFGGLMNDAIRAGTGLLEGSLTVLIRAWMTTVMEPHTEPNLEMSSAAGPIPGGPPQLQDSAAPQMANTTVDTAVPGDQAPEMPTSSPEELMLRGVLRQFMPM